jgi:hypothetical protein
MTTNSQRDIARGGKRWLLLMGPLAILLTIWLYTIDRYLSENDREIRKGELLRVLRTAQSSVPSVSYDDRQGGFDDSSGGLEAQLSAVGKVKEARPDLQGEAKAEAGQDVPSL